MSIVARLKAAIESQFVTMSPQAYDVRAASAFVEKKEGLLLGRLLRPVDRVTIDVG